MLKFDASIFGGELPVGLGVVGIAVVLPGGDFVDEDLFVGNAAIEALGRFEWHYTPKHGSWLNLAESELGVLSPAPHRVPDVGSAGERAPRACSGRIESQDSQGPVNGRVWRH